jgi:hypothetical protein
VQIPRLPVIWADKWLCWALGLHASVQMIIFSHVSCNWWTNTATFWFGWGMNLCDLVGRCTGLFMLDQFCSLWFVCTLLFSIFSIQH